ncbi:GNAT family N-acetyltransferase [Candidatus Bathyarchaeota archaeon]|nr:GNAT family N-acetyltransferase [Candidatus Bathyarchaeota archaeon]
MFEFANLRFRPLEKDDLKLLHVWENDFELMMYSRSKPLNTVSMAQLEKQYEERMKEKNNLYFILENMESNQPIGFAAIRREEWGNVQAADLGTYIGRKEMGKRLRKEDNRGSARNGLHSLEHRALRSVERRI